MLGLKLVHIIKRALRHINLLLYCATHYQQSCLKVSTKHINSAQIHLLSVCLSWSPLYLLQYIGLYVLCEFWCYKERLYFILFFPNKIQGMSPRAIFSAGLSNYRKFDLFCHILLDLFLAKTTNKTTSKSIISWNPFNFLYQLFII